MILLSNIAQGLQLHHQHLNSLDEESNFLLQGKCLTLISEKKKSTLISDNIDLDAAKEVILN